MRFAPNGETLATGSWSGSVKLWNVPACTPIRTLRGKFDHLFWGNFSSCLLGHSDRVGGVAWHPQATLSQSVDSVNLVSGAGDACVIVWSLNRFVYPEASPHFIFSSPSHSETPISVLKGHQDRICRVAFHPSGNYVASASFDTTWRLWDINTSKEILLQEGHSREVYAVEFQDDGALAASAYVYILYLVNLRL